MKKGVLLTIVIVVIIALLLGVLYFINRDSSSSNKNDASLSDAEAKEVVDNLNKDNLSVLVAYYSYTGNTEEMAEEIANQTNGELFEIERKEAYDDLYTEAEDEIKNDERPELSSMVEDIDKYDVIFIGYPIWWDEAPAMINTFLESYNLTNKVVVPFCTSSSDGIENSMDGIRASAKGAAVLDGLRMSSGDASSSSGKEEIANWINGLNIFNKDE